MNNGIAMDNALFYQKFEDGKETEIEREFLYSVGWPTDETEAWILFKSDKIADLLKCAKLCSSKVKFSYKNDCLEFSRAGFDWVLK